MPTRPENNYAAYHAHVYFDEQTLEFASYLCDRAGELFDLPVGRKHRKPVGPHPRWSCQLIFTDEDFGQLIPWLEEHRGGLSILIHPLTGDDYEDHTTHAAWLGEDVPLNLGTFEEESQ